jgi:hypothetical protein
MRKRAVSGALGCYKGSATKGVLQRECYKGSATKGALLIRQELFVRTILGLREQGRLKPSEPPKGATKPCSRCVKRQLTAQRSAYRPRLAGSCQVMKLVGGFF